MSFQQPPKQQPQSLRVQQQSSPNPNPSLISLDDTPSPISQHPSPFPDDDPEEKDYTSSQNPFSAFYSHPPTRTSLEQRASESQVHVSIATPPASTSNLNLTQPPSAATSRPKTPGHSLLSKHCSNTNNPNGYDEEKAGPAGRMMKKACTMWPTPTGSRRQSRHNLTGTVRGSRACAPYRRLSRSQKWMFQIFLALVVIGLGVGLGVGISRAVGAGVWKSNNSRFDIPGEGH